MLIKVNAQTYINPEQIVRVETGIERADYLATMSDGSKVNLSLDVWKIISSLIDMRYNWEGGRDPRT